jgi:hypothetical protein
MLHVWPAVSTKEIGLPQRLDAARKEAEASGAQVMRLEIELAEARKALQATAELEKEVAHYRWAPGPSSGVENL